MLDILKNKKVIITSLTAFCLLANVAFAAEGGGGLEFDTNALTGALGEIISKMGEVLAAVVPKALQIVGVVMCWKFGVNIFHKFSNKA